MSPELPQRQIISPPKRHSTPEHFEYITNLPTHLSNPITLLLKQRKKIENSYVHSVFAKEVSRAAAQRYFDRRKKKPTKKKISI
jgi:hypothetical protein